MQSSNIPARFLLPWAANAGPSYIRTIPTGSQIGITDGAASLNDGFPPLTFTAVAAGGIPPFGADANGFLNWISLWLQWQQAGCPVTYNADFVSAIGGYPKGAILISSSYKTSWMSTAENNTSNPDSGGANWARLDASVQFLTDSGAANAVSVTTSPTTTTYYNGQSLYVKPAHSNTTATTINAGGGAIPLLRSDGNALESGDLVAGVPVQIVIDASGGNAYLIGPAPNQWLHSPTFYGIPAAPTAAHGTSTTQIASTAFVQDAISGIGGVSPDTVLYRLGYLM